MGSIWIGLLSLDEEGLEHSNTSDTRVADIKCFLAYSQESNPDSFAVLDRLHDWRDRDFGH